MSVNDTRATPSAPASSWLMSERPTLGIDGCGNPCGSTPTTETPFGSNTTTARMAPATATRKPGTIGVSDRSTTMVTRQPTPMASAAPTVSPSATSCTKLRLASRAVLPDAENPNSFGSWIAMIVRAMPFM